jgi:uncharacterized membrane protein YkvA (DUF1232 family)
MSMPQKRTRMRSPDSDKISDLLYRLRTKAEEYIRNPDKAKALIQAAWEKTKRKEVDKGPLEEVWETLTLLIRLLQAYIRREYTTIPWGSIVMITAAIIYFVTPVDLVPDFIPVAGYVDDAAVIAFVIKQIRRDLEEFAQWEKSRP